MRVFGEENEWRVVPRGLSEDQKALCRRDKENRRLFVLPDVDTVLPPAPSTGRTERTRIGRFMRAGSTRVQEVLRSNSVESGVGNVGSTGLCLQ